MSDLRKAAEMVVEAHDRGYGKIAHDVAIEALRQALAQPEQEPVIGMFEEKLPDQNPPPWVRHYNACLPTSVKCNAIKYTAPPKREWVGLTEKEIDQCFEQCVIKNFNEDGTEQSIVSTYQAAQAIEDKLKEKNGG